MSDLPQLHDFETDCLPEAHLWAHESILCGHCKKMVHAFNNECMYPWVEWRDKVLCLDCVLLNLNWIMFSSLAGEFEQA
jgi:hypothetical protein